MKFKKILFLLSLLLAFCMPVFADQWYWLSSDDTMTTYLDNEHVYKDDDCAIVWTRTEFHSGRMAGSVIYMQWHVTHKGKISYIYGHGRKANGRLTQNYPDSSYWNKSVLDSPGFINLYTLIWSAKS